MSNLLVLPLCFLLIPFYFISSLFTDKNPDISKRPVYLHAHLLSLLRVLLINSHIVLADTSIEGRIHYLRHSGEEKSPLKCPCKFYSKSLKTKYVYLQMFNVHMIDMVLCLYMHLQKQNELFEQYRMCQSRREYC